MDSNYEAQKQFTRQRLEARREQAAAERLLREGRPARKVRLRQLLVSLFPGFLHRTGWRKEKKHEPEPLTERLALTGKGKA